MNAAAAGEVAALVRDADRDRYLATLFAPADLRGQVFSLYAFNAEIALVRERVSNPTLGEIRYQWWRDVLEGSRAAEGRDHPIAAALLETIEAAKLPVAPLLALIDARTFDLYDDPMPTIGDLEGYAGETASALIRLAGLVLGRGADLGGASAAGHGGVAWAVTGLLRSLPHLARQGRLYIPAEVLARHAVRRDDVLSGRNTPELGSAIREMCDLARRHLVSARAAVLDGALAPAFLPLAQVEPYLRIMERPGFDPFRDPVTIPQWRRQLTFWRAALRGI
jgi:15-cis-phytoene synthase